MSKSTEEKIAAIIKERVGLTIEEIRKMPFHEVLAEKKSRKNRKTASSVGIEDRAVCHVSDNFDPRIEGGKIAYPEDLRI